MRSPKRVQRLLRLRSQEEELARAPYLIAEQVAFEAESIAASAADQFTASVQHLSNQRASLSASAALQAYSMLDRLEAHSKTCQNTAQTRRNEAENAKGPWMEARKTVLAMEKLFERTQSQWRQIRLRKQEQSEQDTIEVHLLRNHSNDK